MFKRVAGLTAAAVLALAAGLMLAGCTLAPADSNFSLEGKGGTGAVFLSLTRTGTVESSMWLKLRGVGNNYSGYVTVDDVGVGRDWAKVTYGTAVNDLGRATKEAPIGHVAAFALPAGDYEFYGWYGASPIWRQIGDDYDVTSKHFSVKFTVRPGQVTYAGNLQIELPDRIIADHYKAEFQITVSDKLERDRAVLRQKYPRLASQTISSVVMNTPNASQPITFYTFPTTGPTRNGTSFQ